MNKNGIGERLALFWVAWAYVAEKAQNYKLADQIFQKGTNRLFLSPHTSFLLIVCPLRVGTRRQAEPKELMAKRYKQFQRRMARLFLNGGSSGDGEGASTSSGDTINEAIVTAAMTAIRAAPSAVAGSAPVSAAPGAKRHALSSLEGDAHNASAAVPAQHQSEPVRSQPSSRSHHSSSTSRSTASSAPVTATARPSAKPQSKNGAAAFEIFSDAPAAGSVATTSRGAALAAVAPHLYEAHLDDARADGIANPTWGTLGTEATRRKENDGTWVLFLHSLAL
jgi:hypothetical protein